MIERIRSFFLTEMTPPAEVGSEGPGAQELRIAACALLLEVANADDHFSEGERKHLRSLVRRHFGLRRDAADELIALAEEERRGRVDLWGFANLVRMHYSAGQKLVLAEAMWGVVLADGKLAAREDYVMRRISGLVGLETGYLAAARRRHDSAGAGEEGGG
ncbi:MAG: TerB family tellurite resistance protein [Gemmatimonadota bacterium]|nr:TerB family tellurite resistance protein [Gemmatimonadota bacterium]